MADHDLTSAGKLRAGFQYQDLVAIEILIELYTDGHLYHWVQLYSVEGRYQSIDDVVARQPDEICELTQGKFAVEPGARASKLSWTLLTKRVREHWSLRQKWSNTIVRHGRAGKLAIAVLKTGRIPDDKFAECLHGRRVINGRLLANFRSRPGTVCTSGERSRDDCHRARVGYDSGFGCLIDRSSREQVTIHSFPYG